MLKCHISGRNGWFEGNYDQELVVAVKMPAMTTAAAPTTALYPAACNCVWMLSCRARREGTDAMGGFDGRRPERANDLMSASASALSSTGGTSHRPPASR
mmetsp:Transcript_5365/g.15337  ORF Transcript_5365/g.15337 Transcript_5365/m.15337 type:complete len:100 (-) Transcript_5365:1101-1400(-)